MSLQVLQLRPDLTTQAGNKTIAHLAGKHQFLAFVVADDQRIERIVWRVSADHERLCLVNLVLEPGTAALTGLVAGVPSLGDDPLKPELFDQWDQQVWRQSFQIDI